MQITNFDISVENSTLDQLRDRLINTRYPDEITDSGWNYGTDLSYLKELVKYWHSDFNWPKQQALINSFSHFRTTVDDINIHFIHEKGKGPDPFPLIITHGWPGTFFEMYKVIPMLTDPQSFGGDPKDSFDVVVPSMPGYGFSDASPSRGMDPLTVADMWATLMSDNLGYSRFGAQGGDWGARVTAKLGLSHSDKVIGIHTTSTTSPTPYLGEGSRPLSESEKRMLEQREKWVRSEGGYAHIQSTKPQTLSYSLNDSPVGLAAWIVEKYRTWSDCEGDIESRFTKDELLTTVTIYWVTESIGSSTRLYYESFNKPWTLKQGERIDVPVAVAAFPHENTIPLREWAERSYNVKHWTDMPSGGHFAALEEPDRLVQDIREFFRTLR
ncbi:epoxide hydrolase [Dehalococcoidia bacterium]|nr:epoxide hydrolase [Dehalococcoidia bacterium]